MRTPLTALPAAVIAIFMPAAPADRLFTIEFDNRDSEVAHNVAIFDRTKGKKPLFKGELIIGPKTTTYSVPAQKPGRYEFVCEPHDFTMIGAFVIGDGNPSAPPSR